jgi:hypothetical protein
VYGVQTVSCILDVDAGRRFFISADFYKICVEACEEGGGVSFTKSITPLNDWRLFMEMETGSVIA